MTKQTTDGPYWEIEAIISQIDAGETPDIVKLREVQENVNDIYRNYNQLAQTMGADTSLVTHQECLEVARILNKVKTGMMHERYEDTGAYFICGETGGKGKDGLPGGILVCPTNGMAGFASYVKNSDYSEPGY